MSEKSVEDKLKEYEKMKAQQKKNYDRRAAKISIILKKAEKAKITCSEAEIDEYLKSKK